MLRPSNEGDRSARIPARTWTWLAVVAAVVGVGLGGDLGRWIGCALILAVLPNLTRPILELPVVAKRRGQISRWLPLGLLVTLTAMLLGDLALGRPPASRDHGVHYFQTKVLVDDLIARGTLIGFSDALNTGYPFGDSYPVLGYLMTGAAHLLSFGLISLRTSYAWGILAIWLLALGAVWWLAATIARELRGEVIEEPPPSTSTSGSESESKPEPKPEPPLAALLDPRWAGALAAIAWLIDPGASREGGWNYLMFHGVWPQLLSSALWIASLPATWVALRRPSPRSLALASLILGASVLAHPFGMLTAATSAAAWPVVLWATGALRKLPGGQIRWWLLIHVLAGLVCVGWVVTFLASAGAMARSPVPWKPLGALAAELLAGELFLDHRAWVGPLMIIGLYVGIRRGRSMAWLGVGLVCALLVLGSEASITVVRLDLVVSSFKNLQFPRYAIALKPVLFAFAGVGGAALVAKLREIPNRDQPASSATRARPAAGRLIACLCLAPLLVGAIDDRDRLFPRPVGGVEVLEGSPHAAVDAALLEALEAEAKAREAAGEGPLDVAFLRRTMGGGTYPLFAITDVDARLVMDGHIPAVNYKYQVRRRSPGALRVMGVTHVIYDQALNRTLDDKRLADSIEPIGKFGVWTLARLTPGNLDQGFVVTGKIDVEDVEVRRLDAETIEVEVREGGPGRVDLPLGPYRKWRATGVDGRPLSLEAVAVSSGIPGLKLPFPKPGVVRLEYRTPPLERRAMWVSLVGIALLLLCLLSSRELQLAVRLQSPRAAQISWALGLLTIAVILVGGYLRQERKLAETWTKVIQDHRQSARLAAGRKLEFRADLVEDGHVTITRSTTDGCDGTLGKDAMAGCTQDDARPRKSMAFRQPFLYRCLHVEVPAGGSISVEIGGLREGDEVAGFFVREFQAYDGLTVTLPGSDLPFEPSGVHKRQHFHLHAEDLAEDTSIEVVNDLPRPEALCFSLAAATKPN